MDSIERPLELDGRDVAEVAVEALRVVPVHPAELATLEYVWWWNNERLHGELDMRTSAEVEQAYYAEVEMLLSPTG